MCHVDLGAEHLRTVRVLALFHFTEEAEILLDRTVAPGAVGTGRLDGATGGTHLFEGLVVDIRETPLDELLSPFIELVEIIRGVSLLRPLETEPFDVFLDGVHILDIFFRRIGVVVAEVGPATVLLRQAEVDTQTFGVAKVKISVGFGRKACDDGVELSGCEVCLDDLFEEIVFLLFFHYASCFKLQIY